MWLLVIGAIVTDIGHVVWIKVEYIKKMASSSNKGTKCSRMYSSYSYKDINDSRDASKGGKVCGNVKRIGAKNRVVLSYNDIIKLARAWSMSHQCCHQIVMQPPPLLYQHVKFANALTKDVHQLSSLLEKHSITLALCAAFGTALRDATVIGYRLSLCWPNL